MSTAIPSQYSPSWTIEDVIQVLEKLPPLDHIRFLKEHFPNERLEEWTSVALLDLSLNVLKIWEEDALRKGLTHHDFLIETTSSLCRASFQAFVRLLWDEVPGSRPLLWNWHLEVLTSAAQATAEAVFAGQRPPDLIVNISPGSSKSTIFSRLLPCWIWTRMPEAGIITASHTEYLVIDLAVHSRDVMNGVVFKLLFPEIEFMENQDAKSHYRNTKGGERFTCTIGGKSPIGKHCNFAIIDDPINPEDVFSEAARRTAANFVTQSIITRRQRGAKADPFVKILIMQRIGMGDPTDAMLEVSRREGAAPVMKICIPAEITDDVEPKELRKYYEGINIDGACATDGLFDPVRFSRFSLNETRASMGEWVYASQFLQSPRPLSGGMFKLEWFGNRVLAAPLRCTRIRYWDRGGSKTETACFTAGVLIAFDGERFYIEDVVHGKWEPDERNAVMRMTAMRDRSRYGKYEPKIYVEAEGGSSGRDAWLGVVRALMGFTVREDIVKGSKDTRAEPWATQMSAHNVFIVDNGESQGIAQASWDINGYIQEHLAFKPEPGATKLGRLKDRVDASCLIAGTLVETSKGSIPIELVKEGDFVYTRGGLRKVVWSGCSGKVDEVVSVLFSNGHILTGTYEHLVLTLGRGFVRLGELTSNDVIIPFSSGETRCRRNQRGENVKYVEKDSWGDGSVVATSAHGLKGGIREGESTSTKPLFSMGLSTEEDFLMEDISGEWAKPCTEMCGSFITGPSPVAIKFITKTKTHLTTRLTILNASLQASMGNFTETSSVPLSTLNISKELEGRRANGTLLRKGGRGIESTLKKHLDARGRKKKRHAISAEKCFSLSSWGEEGSSAIVRLSAVIDIGKQPGSAIIVKKSVNNVGKNLWELVKAFSAAIPVQLHGSGPIEVFDLTIENDHEFFANGVLVHNSGGFNLLIKNKRAYLPLYTYALSSAKKNQGRWIVACSVDELGLLDIGDQRALVVVFTDPSVPQPIPIIANEGLPRSAGRQEEGVGSETSSAIVPGGSIVGMGDRSPDLPPLSLSDGSSSEQGVGICYPKCMEKLELTFADLDPADYQVNYGQPIAPWQRPISELQLDKEQAKKFWSCALKKYDQPWQALILVDQGGEDRRALSTAMAVADMLRIPRSAIFLPGCDNKEELIEDDPPNQWVFEVVKSAKHQVVAA